MVPLSDRLQSVLQSYLPTDQDDIGLAAGMINTSLNPEGAFGYVGSIKSYTNQPLTLGETTLFEIASISKTFCATLFAAFAATRPSLAGSMVSDYHPLGTVPLGKKFEAMPLLSLANYTSGLPADPKDPHDQPRHLHPPYTVSDMYQYLSQIGWTPNPSEQQYTYSNLGFALLGESLGPAIRSGDSYAQLIQDNVLQPLGFSSATMMFPTPPPLSQLPQGYKADGSPGGPGWGTFPAYFGAGGLITTPADLMIWLRFNMGLTGPSDMLSLLPALQTKSTTVETLNGSELGLSWFLTTVQTSSGPMDIVWKNGGLAGFTSYITFLPSPNPGKEPSGAGVFVMSNSNGGNVDELAVVLLSLMAGQGEVAPGTRLIPE